jgi:hypothetical protein
MTRSTHATCPHEGSHRPNITSIEKRRRHQGETAEDGEGDVIPDLLLKHPNEIFATYIRKQLKHLQHKSETHVKTPENA